MSFENQLFDLEFNMETLDLLLENNVERGKIVQELKDIGFDENLTNFLLDTDKHLINCILKRLKLCNQFNKPVDQVHKLFSNRKNMMPLVMKLYPLESESSEKVIEQDDNEFNEYHEESEEAISDENPFDSFFDTKIKMSDDENDTMKASECYNVFKEWYVEKYDNDIPDKKELKNFLNSKKLEKKGKSSWKYVTLN